MSFADLPDINQKPSTFETEFSDELVVTKQNYDRADNLKGPLPTSTIIKHITAEWSNLIDGMIRQLQRKGYGVVNAADEEFGVTGDGVADDAAGIQAAIDAATAIFSNGGIVFLPPAVYALSTPLILSGDSAHLRGASLRNSILFGHPTFSGTSLLELRNGSDIEVSQLQLNIPTGSRGVYVRGAPRAEIHHVNFVGASANNGLCVVLDNRDATATPISGAHSYQIHHNVANTAGKEPNRFVLVEASIAFGNSIYENRVITDDPVKQLIDGSDGGRVYNNLFQSRTGTSGTPAGICIWTGSQTLIYGNRIERYATVWRNDYAAGGQANGLERNVFEDCTETITRTHVAAGNDETIIVTHPQILLNGDGANRTGMLLTDGVSGQRLILSGYTWAITLAGAGNVQFVVAAPSFGNASGKVANMTLVWMRSDAGGNPEKWVEVSRTTRP